VDVAEFHPSGFTAAVGAGAGLGSAVGGNVTDSMLGGAVGGAGGSAAGMAGAAAARGLPIRICVAVSPDLVYLLEIEDKMGVENLDLFAELARSDLGVEVHGRVYNRVVILEDLKTGNRFEMEAPRYGPFHAKAIVELLLLSDEHLESEAAE